MAADTKQIVEPEKKESKNNIITKAFFIQLASVSDENLVIVEWKRLLVIYPELSMKKYDYKKVNLKNGETYYRILLGKFKTKKESEEFCQNILKKNKCLIRSYE
ncbi:MAG: SPOR domain-containing protein [Alphaproteobacteria bacterium TMED93]|nr:MAG: SPOR domain-containing protein [Alphaproteobacteria bacterium TMED93]